MRATQNPTSQVGHPGSTWIAEGRGEWGGWSAGGGERGTHPPRVGDHIAAVGRLAIPDCRRVDQPIRRVRTGCDACCYLAFQDGLGCGWARLSGLG